jgi:hypothetical protein
VSLKGKGGAIYVNMMYYKMELLFTRCLFFDNEAEYGANFFIAYKNVSQRVGRECFMGCTAIVGLSH